eukprot:SAG31_NODE_15615_length_746_cov_1.582689_1_plen_72_part_00
MQWLNPDGMGGDTWLRYELPTPLASISSAKMRAVNKRSTTSYNGVASVNATHGSFTFDYDGSLYAVPFSLI